MGAPPHSLVVRRNLTQRQRWVVAVALVIVLAVILISLRVTSAERLRAWGADCVTKAGTVQTIEPRTYNPLVAESDDPAYLCRGADGQILQTWR